MTEEEYFRLFVNKNSKDELESVLESRIRDMIPCITCNDFDSDSKIFRIDYYEGKVTVVVGDYLNSHTFTISIYPFLLSDDDFKIYLDGLNKKQKLKSLKENKQICLHNIEVAEKQILYNRKKIEEIDNLLNNI